MHSAYLILSLAVDSSMDMFEDDSRQDDVTYEPNDGKGPLDLSPPKMLQCQPIISSPEQGNMQGCTSL